MTETQNINKASRLIDPQEVRRSIKTLIEPGAVFEIRILDGVQDNPRFVATYTGYFKNTDEGITVLLKQLSTMKDAMGIYITAQVVNPRLITRINQFLKRAGKGDSTKDNEIDRYRLLPIDIDPDRPQGIPSTEEEHKAAIERSQEVRDYLRSQGFSAPIEGDSGNGGHLTYLIDLPNTPENSNLIARFLKGIEAKFSIKPSDGSPYLKTDTSVFNPSRVWKLYGTRACKGSDSPDYDSPHRMARLLYVPDELVVVPRDLIESIALPIEEEKPSRPAAKSTGSNPRPAFFDGQKFMDDFIQKYGIEVESSEPHNGGTRYHLASCAWNGHTDNSATLFVRSDGSFGANCNHNSCEGLGWKDFRLAFEPNAYDRRGSMDWKSKSYGPTPSSEETYYNDEPEQPPLETVWQRLNENEWGDALLFAEIFRDRIVYDASNKEYYHWNEQYWKVDSTNYVRQLVSGHLGSVYMKAAAEVNVKWAEVEAEISKLPKGSDKIADLRDEQEKLNAQMDALKKRCYSLRGAKRCQAVLGFVQTDPRMAVTGDCWDKDKWALPVLNGVIDLRTGMLRPGHPRDYIRTVAPVEWEGLSAACPRFERFLNEIFEDRPENERQELIAFLQRLLGYAITGLSEKAIFPILYGKEGRNGKDTLLALIKAILGPLAGAVSNDIFVDSKAARAAGSATPHVCDLQGKRVVWGSETKQGDKLNVPQIKLFTGGGELSTRQLHGRQYAFLPTHTLLLMTNHRPHADADEEAFWARACLIDFKIRFLAPDEVQGEYDRPQDETLKTTLMGELSGILAWHVKGCLGYQKQGFCQPASVRMATAEYRKSEDQIQLFIEESCHIGEKYSVKAKQAYDAYKAWCIENQHSTMNNKLFGEKFGNRFKRERKENGNVYIGVGIIDFNSPSNPVGTVGRKSNPVGTNQDHTGPSEPASEATSDGYQQEQSCMDVGRNELFPLIVPRESGLGPKVEISLHPYSHDSANGHVKPHVEPSEGILYSESSPYSHPTGPSINFTLGIPDDYQQLFAQYQASMPISSVQKVFWHGPGSGYPNGDVSPDEHIARVRTLLSSGDNSKVSAAAEVMERKLGIYGKKYNND